MRHILLHSKQKSFLQDIIDQKIWMRENLYIDSVTRKRIVQIKNDGYYDISDSKMLNSLLDAYKTKELR